MVNSYPRTAVALRSLEPVIGRDAFLRGMRHFAEEWRYRHPYPQDFYATFQRGAEVEIDWYFREVFQGTGTVDWSVSVSQRRRPKPIGYFQSEGGEFFEEKHDGSSEDEAPWEIEVELRRAGTLRLPVTVRLTFEDGTTEDVLWSREEQEGTTWTRLERSGANKLVSAVVDPQRSYFLDTDMSNNRWVAATEGLTPWRWGERVLSQYQRFFHWIGGLGG